MNPFKGKAATAVLDLSDRNGKRTGVQYHDTIIVEFTYTTIRLNTGGWYTATTKRRMNQVSQEYDLGFHVYQKYGSWWVEPYRYLYPLGTPKNGGAKMPFIDNMIYRR